MDCGNGVVGMRFRGEYLNSFYDVGYFLVWKLGSMFIVVRFI